MDGAEGYRNSSAHLAGENIPNTDKEVPAWDNN